MCYDLYRDHKGEIDKSTIIGGNFNTILSVIDRTSRQKIRNDIQYSNNTGKQPDLINIEHSNNRKSEQDMQYSTLSTKLT